MKAIGRPANNATPEVLVASGRTRVLRGIVGPVGENVAVVTPVAVELDVSSHFLYFFGILFVKLWTVAAIGGNIAAKSFYLEIVLPTLLQVQPVLIAQMQHRQETQLHRHPLIFGLQAAIQGVEIVYFSNVHLYPFFAFFN